MSDGRVRGLVAITFAILPPQLAGADERGRVAEWSLDAQTRVTHAVLDNGVVLHHRAAAGGPGRLLVSISLGGGRIEETAANAGVSHAALLAFSGAQEAVRGGDCEIATLAEFDALTLTLAGTVEGVSRGMERVAECLRRPRIEQRAFDAWRQRATAQVELLSRSPEYCASRALLQAISGDDVRVTPVTPRQLERLELSEAQRWIERLSREAPLEIALIGDVSWDRAKLLIEENFGHLPSRPRDAARLTNLRVLARYLELLTGGAVRLCVAG
ncbi:MAG: insulinase family protein [Phycisphaerae bacterium]|nr:insulinase family protein [Phycisphaerae bacterium]